MVDAVNNNRDAVYTGIGAGVGAVAGGAYGGWLSKPLLKGDAPSDAFVKRFYDNDVKNAAETAGENAKKAFEAFKDSDVAALKAELEANPEKYGIKIETGADKAAKINEYVDNLDKDGLRAKMEKDVVETAKANAPTGQKSGKELTNLKKAFDKLGDNPDENAVKDFVKKHAEILGENNKGITKYTDLQKAIIGDDSTKGILSPLEEAKGKILEHFDVKEGMKKLADNADESTKSAFEAVKKAAKDTKLWAGAKWAAIGAAVIGVCSYIGAKMTAPKAPAETPSENA